MQYKSIVVKCREIANYSNSCRTQPFTYTVYTFDYQSNEEDRITLDSIIENARAMAEKVNAGAANLSFADREKQRILNNCVAGVLAEYCWKHLLNYDGETVEETEFTSANGQIDLRVIHNGKTIEVRSSFPVNGIEFAICHPVHEFDILGPYANLYKPGEIQKDFYVRTLYPFRSSLMETKIKEDGFSVYLTGGATWAMMTNDSVSFAKDLIPQDVLDPKALNSQSMYRVVPFSKAHDTAHMYRLIKKQ